MPLVEENKDLRVDLSMMQTMLKNNKKKNDERFDILTKNIDLLSQHLNTLTNKKKTINDT